MSDFSRLLTNLPPEQEAIRAKCFHPSERFEEFPIEDVEKSIPDRFEKIVRLYPDRIAVKTGNQAVTYAELNVRANCVARGILAQRREGEEPVVLLLEHGVDVIAAILGVMKSGKICVPLDPSSPYPRITHTLEDSKAGLIVTNDKNLPLVAALARGSLRVLNIGVIDVSLSTEDLGLQLSPDGLAYILYTSGSTGQPKGVMHNHRNLLHKSRIYTNDLHICVDDRLTLLHSCSSAASLRHIFAVLLNGAALFSFDLHAEGLSNLAPWLIREKITICHMPASVFRGFASMLSAPEQFSALRVLYVANESVFKRDVELYRAHFSPSCLFVNALVASEALTVRQYFIDKETSITGSHVPVGYDVQDEEVLLLDEDGQDVGVNCIGEIAVKSHYLARGYWHQPELTNAAFLPDPEGSGARIYRTGDLGRMLPDRCLIHLGRKDFQVKVRGNRVSVLDIELALLDHAAIKDAVVVAREDASNNTHLVAYIVPADTAALTVSELRRFLRGKFPDYMVPSVFVLLVALPRTPNGKVDRRALPAPPQTRPTLETSFIAPSTPIEAELARLWVEVLGLDEVGIHDPFLELGGDSLLAARMINRVLDTFHVEVPQRALVEASTVAHMAEIIMEHRATQIGHDEMMRMLAEVKALSEIDEKEKR